MKKLSNLIACDYDVLISGIATDSRKVKPGDLFICIHGMYFNRHDFIDEAIEKGAVAIIVDQQIKKNIPTVVVKNTNEALLDICEKFYDNPCKKLNIIGITGTDGKTTTAMMIYQLLNNYSNTSYIGTNGLKYNSKNIATNNTTPLPEELYYYLDNIKKAKCNFVSLEVSSEALLHNRVDKIPFDITVLTNITEDHLNIHKTKENYIKAKGKLFTLTKDNGICILNKDDDNYSQILKYCTGKKIYTYGQDKTSDFQISNIKENDGTSFFITYQDEKIEINSPYLGKYNVYNLTTAFIVCYLKGCNKETLIKNIKKMIPIDGRGEYLDYHQDYKIILDYAHTENAIKNVLTMVKDNNHGKIITVTGSAGGREKEKRKGMGRTVLDLSSLVIFTMDDPREEDVNEIINDLVSETKNKNYLRILDRKEAINYALSIAKKDDVVLILGKGKDKYMAIGKEHLPYSDIWTIEEYFKGILK